MRLKNDEKRWLLKGAGWLGAFVAFGLLDGLLGFLVGLAIWAASLILVVRLGLGKEND